MTRPLHMLMTRFNVRLDAASPPPTDEWLRDRLELFTRYTFESVKTQTCAPDSWLVFCGPSPPWLRQALDDLRARLPLMRPVFVDDVFRPDVARKAVEANLPATTKVLISTRVDNDDAIAQDYVQAIQNCAADHRNEFVNFTRGVQLASERLYYRSDPANAFISFVEAVDRELQTVFVDQHHLLHRHGRVAQIHCAPMWLQVIHGRNLANRAGGVRADPRKVRPYFAVAFDVTSESLASLRADQAFTTLRMAVKVASKPSRMKWLLRTLRR